MLSRLASGAAALSLAGLVVAAPLPASAQDPGQGSERCEAAGAPGNAPQYPPSDNAGVSDSNAERGQQMSASSGCARFAPGRQVAFGVESVFQQLGSVIASVGGEATATFTVPTNLVDGQHHVVFRGASLTGAPTEVRIPFTVSGGVFTGPGAGTDAGTDAGAGAGAGNDGTVSVGGVQLPRTGSDEILPLTALGLGLVAAGAAMVVVARRRRNSATLAA